MSPRQLIIHANSKMFSGSIDLGKYSTNRITGVTRIAEVVLGLGQTLWVICVCNFGRHLLESQGALCHARNPNELGNSEVFLIDIFTTPSCFDIRSKL